MKKFIETIWITLFILCAITILTSNATWDKIKKFFKWAWDRG